jgi:hypothetical protein
MLVGWLAMRLGSGIAGGDVCLFLEGTCEQCECDSKAVCEDEWEWASNRN